MSTHQYAMVMDLNKCIGCHTCSIACKKQWTDRDGLDYVYWNNVESHPGVGYPRGWHTLGGGFDNQRHLRPSPLPPKADYGEAFEYDYAQRLFEGKGKPVMPHADPTFAPNWDEDVGGWDPSNPYFFYLPRICNHCTYPACLEACPRKAIYKRQEDGIVVIDQERCQGYRYCIQSCPYKKIYFNEVTGKSEKCIFCYPRLEKGVVNACAAQCPGRIRFVGILDDPESPTHKLVLKHKVALGLLPERGTGPNVYYVPPFNPPKRGHAGRSILEDPRLPLDYLKYLFGPEVVRVVERLEGELARAQKGEVSEILQLLIGRDASVRYRVVPKTIREAAPAEIRGATDTQAAGPPLTRMGTPDKGGSASIPEPVREAFGLAAATPGNVHEGASGRLSEASGPVPEASGCSSPACGGCSLAQSCSPANRPLLRGSAQDGESDQGGPWF